MQGLPLPARDSVSRRERIFVPDAWQVVAAVASAAAVGAFVAAAAASAVAAAGASVAVAAVSVAVAAASVAVAGAAVGERGCSLCSRKHASSAIERAVGAGSTALEAFSAGGCYPPQAGQFVFVPAGCLDDLRCCFCGRNSFPTEHSMAAPGLQAGQFAAGVQNPRVGCVSPPWAAAKRPVVCAHFDPRSEPAWSGGSVRVSRDWPRVAFWKDWLQEHLVL